MFGISFTMKTDDVLHGHLWTLLMVTAVVCFSAHLTDSRKLMPRKYGKAVSDQELDTKLASTRKKIELYHNYFRTKVDPPARDMLMMTWHDSAAEDARRWANECELLTHDNVTGRWVEEYGSCGQNIFVSNVKVPWLFAIKIWFLERRNFTYGADDNDLEAVGHYTQLVWYSSHSVGCSIHHCSDAKPKPYYNYVCNYCPIGNFPDRIGKPYEEGKPCSNCTDSCRFQKLCTNACPYADHWMNCRELNSTWHDWLCSGDNERSCLATCHCGFGQIR